MVDENVSKGALDEITGKEERLRIARDMAESISLKILKIYPYALITRKLSAFMIRKLSVTESQRDFQLFGI